MLAWRAVVLRESVTPTHYPHGSLRVALGLSPAKGFDPRPLLHCFGDSVPAARCALRQWIARRPDEGQWRAWELSRGLVLATFKSGRWTGAARAVQGGAAALIAAGGSYGVEGALDALQGWVGLRLHAHGLLGVPPGRAVGCPPGSTQAAARCRGLVACLAVDHQLCPAAAVARHFDRAKATLCEQMAACRRRSADRAILATPLSRILDEIASLPVDDGAEVLTKRLSPAPPRPRPRTAGAEPS